MKYCGLVAYVSRLPDPGLLSTEGDCYIAEYPRDRTVKVGWSQSAAARLPRVARDYNDGVPLTPLAVLSGGPRTEAQAHAYLAPWRRMLYGERFAGRDPQDHAVFWQFLRRFVHQGTFEIRYCDYQRLPPPAP